MAIERGWLYLSDKEAMIVQDGSEPFFVAMRTGEGENLSGTLAAIVSCVYGTVQLDTDSDNLLHVVEGKVHPYGADELLEAVDNPPDGLKITLME